MIQFHLQKTFRSHGKQVQIDLKANWEQGKIIAVYGKSGVGKSSLLRMLAGLIKPDAGKIAIDQDIWFDSEKKINLKANKRHIGFLFQDYSLFPNMNVLKNIRYGIKGEEDVELVQRIIDIAGLGDLLKRMPANLSGGQQQRVALARAIVRKPKLLLLDEPLSALDPEMRLKLQEEILAIQSVIETSIVFVSHHLPEVFKLSDEVYMIEEGAFTKSGSPSEVFRDMKMADTEVLGELLSIQQNDMGQLAKVLIDGKVVGVQLPK